MNSGIYFVKYGNRLPMKTQSASLYDSPTTLRNHNPGISFTELKLAHLGNIHNNFGFSVPFCFF